MVGPLGVRGRLGTSADAVRRSPRRRGLGLADPAGAPADLHVGPEGSRGTSSSTSQSAVRRGSRFTAWTGAPPTTGRGSWWVTRSLALGEEYLAYLRKLEGGRAGHGGVARRRGSRSDPRARGLGGQQQDRCDPGEDNGSDDARIRPQRPPTSACSGRYRSLWDPGTLGHLGRAETGRAHTVKEVGEVAANHLSTVFEVPLVWRHPAQIKVPPERHGNRSRSRSRSRSRRRQRRRERHMSGDRPAHRVGAEGRRPARDVPVHVAGPRLR